MLLLQIGMFCVAFKQSETNTVHLDTEFYVDGNAYFAQLSFAIKQYSPNIKCI